MFEYNKHIIDYNNTNQPFFIKKKAFDGISLQKEIILQNLLSQFGICPLIIFSDDLNSFQEQLIQQKKWNKQKKIIGLAKNLKKLHNINISSVPIILKKLLNNNFIINNTFQIIYLFDFMLKEINQNIFENDLICKIRSRLENYQFKLNKNINYFSIIHGDLNVNNILTGNSLFLIDFSDARIDLPIFDISQLFYHFKRNNKERELFLKNYGHLDHLDFIEIHTMLLYLYDLIIYIKKNQTMSSYYITQIKNLFYKNI